MHTHLSQVSTVKNLLFQFFNNENAHKYMKKCFSTVSEVENNTFLKRRNNYQ